MSVLCRCFIYICIYKYICIYSYMHLFCVCMCIEFTAGADKVVNPAVQAPVYHRTYSAYDMLCKWWLFSGLLISTVYWLIPLCAVCVVFVQVATYPNGHPGSSKNETLVAVGNGKSFVHQMSDVPKDLARMSSTDKEKVKIQPNKDLEVCLAYCYLLYSTATM